MLRRADALGAVSALLRAAELSPACPDRSRRLARAAFVGASVTLDVDTVSSLLSDARQAGPAEHVAYWDAAAALCTVGDMGDCLPGDLLGEVGRPDLNAALLTARRDAFLAAALDKLDSR